MDSLDFSCGKCPCICIWDPLSPETLTGRTGQCHPGQVTWGSWQRIAITSAWFYLVFYFLFSSLFPSFSFLSPLLFFLSCFSFFLFLQNVSWLFLSLYAVASSSGPKSGAQIWGVLGGRACDFSLVLKESLRRSQNPFVVLSRLYLLSWALKAVIFPFSCFNVMVQIRETIPAILSRKGFHMGSRCSQEGWKERLLLLREERLQAGLEGWAPDSSTELAS